MENKKYYLAAPMDFNNSQIVGVNLWAIRQTRFIGQNHPHDIMCVDSNRERLFETWGAYFDINDVDLSVLDQ